MIERRNIPLLRSVTIVSRILNHLLQVFSLKKHIHKLYIIYLIFIFLLSWNSAKTQQQGSEKIIVGFSTAAWQKEGDTYKAPVSFQDTSITEKINTWIKQAKAENAMMVLKPDPSKKSWNELGLGKTGIRVFLLNPGDYRKYGVLNISNKNGSESKPCIVAALAEGSTNSVSATHPVKWSGNASKEILLEALQLKNSDYWIFYGITFRGNNALKGEMVGGNTNMIRDGADYNIIANCLVEKVLEGSFIRILNSSFNRIQTCVIRDKVAGPKGDNVGILISAYGGLESRGNVISSNEIYNVTDDIAISRQDANVNKNVQRPQTGEAPGTVIENNDLYITPALYKTADFGKSVSACAENALDLKTGTYSDKSEDKILIMYNRMWGFRKSENDCGASGSAGQAVVLHRNAANIFFYNNIVSDAPGAVWIMGTNPLYPSEKVKNIDIINNIFYNINRKSEGDVEAGEVFHLARTAQVYNNTIISCDIALRVMKTDEQISFKGNFINNTTTLVNAFRTEQGYEVCGNIDLNSNQAAKTPCDCIVKNIGTTDFKFRRKLLTDAEITEIPGVILTASSPCELPGNTISILSEKVSKEIKRRKTDTSFYLFNKFRVEGGK